MQPILIIGGKRIIMLPEGVDFKRVHVQYIRNQKLLIFLNSYFVSQNEPNNFFIKSHELFKQQK